MGNANRNRYLVLICLILFKCDCLCINTIFEDGNILILNLNPLQFKFNINVFNDIKFGNLIITVWMKKLVISFTQCFTVRIHIRIHIKNIDIELTLKIQIEDHIWIIILHGQLHLNKIKRINIKYWLLLAFPICLINIQIVFNHKSSFLDRQVGISANRVHMVGSPVQFSLPPLPLSLSLSLSLFLVIITMP